MNYDKEPKSPEEHIELLRERGLEIKSYERAIKYLINVGYYRLSGYMYHLQSKDGNHSFFEGTDFNLIIEHYQFDKKLRAIVSEYLERIEVAIRARLTDSFSISHGFFWHDDLVHYDDRTVYEIISSEIRCDFAEPQEMFLKKFKGKYTSESIPPSNMALEIVSFGKIARLYKGLKNSKEKQEIANDFHLPSPILTSWLVYLANVRNICAHHSRLWNRRVTADRPIIPSRKKYKFEGELPRDFNTTLYGIISLIDRLLKGINPNNSFSNKIENLIEQHPVVKTSYMGFPDNWKDVAPWRLV